MRRVVTVRQIWREEVGRKKEGNRRNARKLTQACLQTASLLEDIQPISLARIIHVDSSRKRADVKRDGHSEA